MFQSNYFIPFLFTTVILLFSCSSEGTTEKSDKEAQEETIFEAFSGFPEQPFKNLEFGQTPERILTIISTLPVQKMAGEEVHHFYFDADSTELILPFNHSLTEFKVFLKSKHYFYNETSFVQLLASKATTKEYTPTYSVYHYQLEKRAFKLTYFKHANSIRLHFIQLSNPS